MFPLSKKIVVRIVGILLAAGLVGFIAIQFVPVDRSNPPVVHEPAWDSPQTRELMAQACYDCHSNETVWPAYAYVAPVSWLIADEVEEGRHELNFSRWDPGENEEGLETIEEIRENKMPPRQYLLLHPEARLTNAEVEQLVAGLKATFGDGASEAEYSRSDAAESGEEHEDDD